MRTVVKKFFLRVAKGYKLQTYMIRFDPEEISLVKENKIYILTAKIGAVKISLVKEEQRGNLITINALNAQMLTLR